MKFLHQEETRKKIRVPDTIDYRTIEEIHLDRNCIKILESSLNIAKRKFSSMIDGFDG